MATTIDKLDISVYNLYAIRQKLIEDSNLQLRFDQASTIPPQTQVVNTYPTLSELDILLGIPLSLYTPWAYFLPPSKFHNTRRSPFSFSRIAPSLGTDKDQEEGEILLDNVVCSTKEEEVERSAIKNCFKQMSEINRWLGHIVGRVGQFLQG